MSTRLPRITHPLSPRPNLRGILSPTAKKKTLTVRFQFPSQLSSVKSISQEMDDLAASLSCLKTKSVPLIRHSKAKLDDQPISFARLKSPSKPPTKEEIRARTQTLVLLSGVKDRRMV